MSHLPPRSAFTTLCSDALPSELWAAVQGLLGENGALAADNAQLAAENEKLKARLAELEAKLNRPAKTPSNSSVPPSRGQKANRPAGEVATKRTKASHPGVGRQLCETPDHTHVAIAKACPHCAAAVTAESQSLKQLYERIEIPPIKPVVTQVQRHGGVCPCCQKQFLAPVPKGLEPGSPFGSSVAALAVNFHHNQAVSFERLAALFGAVFGLKISEGAIGNIFKRSMPAFANQTVGIKARLLKTTIISSIIGSDETTVRVNKVNWWQWVFRPDLWVSDRLGSQQGWAKVDWQVCLSHQLRDIEYAIESGDTAFAPVVKKILQDAIGIGHRRPDLADSTLKQYRATLDRRLDAALKLKPAGGVGVALRRQCMKFRSHFFVFVTNRAVPPTNNSSEQSLRFSKILLKVINCFRSDEGAEFFADVRSVIETGRRQGLTAFEAIRRTLDGETLFASG
jgi:transposase